MVSNCFSMACLLAGGGGKLKGGVIGWTGGDFEVRPHGMTLFELDDE